MAALPPEPRRLRVVVLSYNTRELLAACLRSLLADPESAAWRLVVVDNASTDGSPQMVREEFPGVTLIESAENRGFSAGNNLGTRDAQEPLLLFLNSDTLVPPGALPALLAFMRDHPDCAAVGPRLTDPDGTPQHSCRTFPGPLNTLLEGFWLDRLAPRSRLLGRPRMTWLDPLATATVDYVSGAALLVRREAFEAVGGWPEEYFFYAEDADLCRQLAARGSKVCYRGEVAIVHLGGASAQQSTRAAIEAHRSVLIFALRSRGAGGLLLQRLATLAVTVPRLVLAALSLPVAGAMRHGGQAWDRLRLLCRVVAVAVGPLHRREPNAAP